VGQSLIIQRARVCRRNLRIFLLIIQLPAAGANASCALGVVHLLIVLVGRVDAASFVEHVWRFLLVVAGVVVGLHFGDFFDDFGEDHGRVRLLLNIFFLNRLQRSLIKKCFILLILRLIL